MLSFVRNEKRSRPETTKTISNKDIGTLWRNVARTYDDNLRDRVYAYGGWDSFARIDRLYVDSTDPCRYIVLLDAHDRDLAKYVRAAETLAKRHATAIVSLTWFALQEDKCSENERRLESMRFERDFMAACGNDAFDESSEDSNEEFEFHGSGSRKTISSATNDFLENGNKRRRVRETSKKSTSNEPPEVRDPNDAFATRNVVERAEEVSEEERCHDDLDAGCLVRAVLVSSESIKRNVVRNVTLAQFFAEMILYLRPFAICDRVGLIRHKAFRLIHKDVVDGWCDATADNVNGDGDVRDDDDWKK